MMKILVLWDVERMVVIVRKVDGCWDGKQRKEC